MKDIPPRQILQPLWPLGVLSITVALLDLLRLPDWFEHLVWVILLVLSSLFFGMIQPVRRYERFIRRAHPYVLAVLVAVAILGWGNLAILASTLWGVVALAIQLSLGAVSVVRVFFERMDKTGMRAVAADLGVMTFISGNCSAKRASANIAACSTLCVSNPFSKRTEASVRRSFR